MWIYPLTLALTVTHANPVAGRNAKCARAFAEERIGGNALPGEQLWEQLEESMLKGQKLQGTSACEEVSRQSKVDI